MKEEVKAAVSGEKKKQKFLMSVDELMTENPNLRTLPEDVKALFYEFENLVKPHQMLYSQIE
jgi:hypothetical protein